MQGQMFEDYCPKVLIIPRKFPNLKGVEPKAYTLIRITMCFFGHKGMYNHNLSLGLNSCTYDLILASNIWIGVFVDHTQLFLTSQVI